jgi:hypothetical protein
MAFMRHHPQLQHSLTLENRIHRLKLFKLFVSFLKDADLIGCKSSLLTATKAERTTAKKANFNQKLRDI